MCGHGWEPQSLPDRRSTSRIARPGSPGWRGAARGVHRDRLGDKFLGADNRQEERMEIAGQAAIVSGGASGLGRATAEALTAAGVKVAILDVNEAAATAAAREMGGFAIGCDVTAAVAVEAAVSAAHQRHGPARIAVN